MIKEKNFAVYNLYRTNLEVSTVKIKKAKFFKLYASGLQSMRPMHTSVHEIYFRVHKSYVLKFLFNY